mgnify:CR=1 FL=1
MLYGSVGTGKTQFAKLIANKAKIDMYSTSAQFMDKEATRKDRLSDLASKQAILSKVGESCILFDEAEDVMNRGFTEFGSASKAYLNNLIEETPIPIFWTTNNIYNVDPAFLRRMTYTIEFKKLTDDIRLNIWKRVIRKNKFKINKDKLVELNKNYDIPPALITNAVKTTKLVDGNQDDFEGFVENLAKVVSKKKNVKKKKGFEMQEYNDNLVNSDLDINEVTEIFVRINSQGKRLNESDFAMSKIAADSKYGGHILRKAIDYFCHLAVEPSFYEKLTLSDSEFMQSEFAQMLKWLKDDRENIYNPDYNDMLRVCLMHKFGRGKLKDLVNLLSGRDFEYRTYKEEIAENSFQQLTSGVKNFMNEYNFKNFVLLIKSCGFINIKLLNSKMTLDFAYTLFLILNNSKNIDKSEIKKFVQKWFILSTLTSRYIGSPESQMDRDLRNIEEKGFKNFFKEVEDAELSDTFWEVGLVQNLETSSINSPYFNTFIAAQVCNAEQSLFSSTTKVSDLVSVTGDIHHIFPKEYLKQNGYDDKSKYNQVANYTYLDTSVNISIGKKSPNEYFNQAKTQCNNKECCIGTILNENELFKNLKVNCIPYTIFNMQASDYETFLQERRKMMAKKIKNYYYSI